MLAQPGTTSRDRLLRRVLRSAAFSPPSLGLTAAAVVFATDPHTWLAAAMAAGLNGFLIFLRARSPAYVRRVATEMQREQWRELAARADALERSLDKGPAAMLAHIVRSQERLLALAAENHGAAPGWAQTANLMNHCLLLAEKRLQMETFLAESRQEELEREADALRVQVAACDDPVACRLYGQALQQKVAEIENRKAIRQAIARIDGQMAAVEATYDNLLGKIARLKIAPGDTTDEEHVMAELDRLTQGIAALDASLGETLTLRGLS